MKRSVITYDNNAIHIPKGEIWMTAGELAKLFDETATTIRYAIKAICKLNHLPEYETTRYIKLDNGYSDDVYSLEIVILLAYRLNGYPAKLLRERVIEGLMKRNTCNSMVVCIENSAMVN